MSTLPTSPKIPTRDHLPRIARPETSHCVTRFAIEVGEAMRHQRRWFTHHGEVVVIDQSVHESIHRPLLFSSMESCRAITALEEFITPGMLRRDRSSGEEQFLTRSLDHSLAAKLLKSPEFNVRLPKVRRILDLPVPVVTPDGSITLPQRGYDAWFETLCDAEAPEPVAVPLNKALAVLEGVHTDFLWEDDASRVHALARMITPYCRGLMGWTAKTPLWTFTGDIGKDYLASLTEVVYQGAYGCHYARSTRGLIGYCILAGRRRIHLTDCCSRSQLRAVVEAVSRRHFQFKVRNRETILPIELELSISGSRGPALSDALLALVRVVQIKEAPGGFNRRKFKFPNLRELVLQNRAQVLGAIKSLVDHWIEKGRHAGPNTLASFPEWSRVVGGVMHVNGLGDPCLPLHGN